MKEKIANYWLPVLGIIFIVLGPIFFLWVPLEVTKWQVASALELQRDGKPKEAIERLRILCEQSPTNVLVQNTYLQLLSESGNKTETVEKIVELDKWMPKTITWLKRKSYALHNVSEHKAAYLLWEKVIKEKERFQKKQHEALPTIYSAPKRSITDWNDLTYFSSLATTPDSSTTVTRHNLSGLNTLMDTAWEMQFIHIRCLALTQVNQAEKALSILRKSLPKFEMILQDEQIQLSRKSYFWLQQTKFPGNEEPKDVNRKRSNVAAMRQGLRQLAELQIDLLRATGEEKRTAEVAKSWKEKFLFDNLLVEKEKPSVRFLCNQLRAHAAYLDTRGFARSKVSMWTQALEDLDAAVEAAELVTALQEKAQHFNTHREVDKRDIENMKADFDRSKAIYYYHRSLIHKRQKHEFLEKHDLKMVSDLGFEPGENLF